MGSRGLRLGCLILAGLAVPASATADPIAECREVTADRAALDECLDGRLENSHGAMLEALGGARAAARRVDRQRGGEMATLGIEASQNAWAAYRDTLCETWAAFVDGEAAAHAVELACAIEQTDQRAAMLDRLATIRNR